MVLLKEQGCLGTPISCYLQISEGFFHFWVLKSSQIFMVFRIQAKCMLMYLPANLLESALGGNCFFRAQKVKKLPFLAFLHMTPNI